MDKIINKCKHILFCRYQSTLTTIRTLYISLIRKILVFWDGIYPPTGKLDYKNSEISMVVNSLRAFGRLHACQKEPETVQWIHELLKPGDIFYDIGANVGAYSLVAASVTSGQCTVYAFEPSFSTFENLNQNIFLNQRSNSITPFQVALSDRTCLETFNYFEIIAGSSMHNFGEALVGPDQKTREAVYKQTLLAYRLDDFIKEFDLLPPNLMKIDVDGLEWRVITGAQNTLSCPGLRSILIEIDERNTESISIKNKLLDQGFKIRNQHQRSPYSYNYIFFRK